MATNNIKPFATSSSANVLNDTELASRSELQTGFPFKSKADSKLVGKLVQNATAGAYAVGEFSAKYGTTDITGSDATGFATAFESALQAYVNERAPEETLTGTATLNGQNIATVNQIPDTSTFATKTELAGYLPLAGGTVSGPVTYNAGTIFNGGIEAYGGLNVLGSIMLDDNKRIETTDSGTGGLGIFNNKLVLDVNQDFVDIYSTDSKQVSLRVNGSAVAIAKNVDVLKISSLGSRGRLGGFENTFVTARALTVTQNSQDSQQITAAVTITVSDGTANTAWVKKISIKDAGVTISLGSAWSWAGGSQPTVTAPSLLILSWDNDCGIAILQTTGS